MKMSAARSVRSRCRSAVPTADSLPDSPGNFPSGREPRTVITGRSFLCIGKCGWVSTADGGPLFEQEAAVLYCEAGGCNICAEGPTTVTRGARPPVHIFALAATSAVAERAGKIG